MSTIHVARNGAPLGTFTLEEINTGLASGRFLLSDLGWRDGMPAWVSLNDWPEFAAQRLTVPAEVPIPGEPEIPEPAWERRKELGAWQAFWQTVRAVLFSPSKVFSALSWQGGIGGALAFYVIVALPLTIVGSVITAPINKKIEVVATEFVFTQTGQDYEAYRAQQEAELDKLPANMREMMQTMEIGGQIVGGAFGVLIGIFISSGVAHLMLLLLRGANAPFSATFRALAYVFGALAFFTWLPLLGVLIGLFWGIPLEIIALSRTHRISTGKATAAVLLPFLLAACCAGAFIGIVWTGLQNLP